MNKHPALQKIAAILLLYMAACVICVAIPDTAKADKNIVRVLLTKLNVTDQLTVSMDGSYTIDKISFQRGARVTLSCATGRIIAYYEGMAFDMGQQVALIRHDVADGKENGLRLGGGYALYCGDLYVTTDGQQLQCVLHIPVEEYLMGVVPYEMSDSFPLEALKAQAIAARTYAMRKTGGSGSYDLVDNTNDQVYRGYQKENENAIRAVRETEGVCGYYNGNLAMCYYTASNGGQVELVKNVWGDAGEYITMHEDPYDVENPESVVKRVRLSKTPQNGMIVNQAFTDALKGLLAEPLAAKGFSEDAADMRIVGIESVGMHTPQGGANSLVMTQMRMSLRIEARRPASQAVQDDTEKNLFAIPEDARTANPASPANPSPFIALDESIAVDVPVFSCVEPLLGLSINGGNNEIITVVETDSAFEICSRRYGHGVGMSQRGAQWMAGQYGWNYEQILRFYYPGLTFKKVNTQVTLPTAIAADFLTTPGPAATPTPRPTLMPATQELKKGEWRAKVTQISANSSLNLRSAPSTSAEIQRVLYYGQELIVIERLDDGWIHVKTDAAEGYVMEKFVEAIQ